MTNTSTSPKNQELSGILIKLLPLIAFAVPLGLLYFLSPGSFELMWKGRTFQLFFVWLVALEFIFSWETIQSKINLQNKRRLIVFAITLLIPTLYVVLEYYLGLNSGIVNWSAQNGVTWADSMPLAIEYLVFSVLFSATVFLSFGKKGLTGFALPALFASVSRGSLHHRQRFSLRAIHAFPDFGSHNSLSCRGRFGFDGQYCCAWN